MQYLHEISNKLLKVVKTDFQRSLYTKINWNQRLIEIKGSRGVGKTTLMLQKAKELQQQNPLSVLYITLDDAYFFNHTIVETAEEFNKYGGKFIFIDEVHKYPSKQVGHDWSAEIKNIYDLIPEISIVYSGSSIIELYKGNGDLSRRKSTYTLNGMSFREYLAYNNALSFEVLTFNQILENHIQLAENITSQLKILPPFKNYLLHGYYPFYNEETEQYYQRIKNIINVILEVDIPSTTDITFETIGKIKKLLAALATTVPYTPNLSQLSANLNITDLRTLYKYLNFIEKAELITLLKSKNVGNKLLQKPEKIFLNNTNILYALCNEQIEIGTVRELFFCNQLNYTHQINYPKQGDFIVDNKYTFEIGGKNKNAKQINSVANSFLVLDEIETGFNNKIPLWLFGFLY